MKRGFTMIELIFVIVILGILASVAIPKLGASREDAKASTVVSTLTTLKSALPAYYTSQKDATISKAVSLDPGLWIQTSGKEEYAYKDGTDTIVTIRVVDGNSTDCNSSTAISSGAGNAAPTVTYPYLQIVKGSSTTNSVHKQIWDNNMTAEVNISVRGASVVR